MKISQLLIATLKETPNDAELISHQLMLRAGLIRKLGAGLYTWLPMGLRVLRKIERIVREEMNRIHAQELLMPAIQPAELWKETGRWETFGGLLLTITDSNEREYCFGPTHEEVITDLMRQELRSYKQLPANFYQIQTKFRDEIRPRFGVMRAREFLMKDAYSFHLNEESLQKTYAAMYEAYSRMLARMGLTYRVVEADTGAIGGSTSHEFQVMAEAGEDLIYYSDSSSYAANVEQATYLLPAKTAHIPDETLETVSTPQLTNIPEVSEFLQVTPAELVKTLIVKGTEHPLVALVIRGDDELNPIKAAKHPWVSSPLCLAEDQAVLKTIKAPVGFLGPVNLDIPIIVDHLALAMDQFICGANQIDTHLKHVSWNRDARYDAVCDLRNVKPGDPSPDGKGTLAACRGIEVGHIFQLGEKYSAQMKAQVLNEAGKLQLLKMGTYGLGVSRLVAAVIEQHHDERGIIWPQTIAPFEFLVIPLQGHRSEVVQTKGIALYEHLQSLGYDVLLEDRQERPGVLFADADLIGIPHRFLISERLLANDKVEYKARNQDTAQEIALSELETFISSLASK